MAFCGGFVCTKNALTALNSIYILVGVLLIVMGVLAKGSSVVTSLPTVAGIIAAGVFLFLVAILGLYGAARHHQVILFFYMVILFLIFLIQFFVAVACLAISESQIQKLVQERWNYANEDVQHLAMRRFHCCAPNQTVELRQQECYTIVPDCAQNSCQTCEKVIPVSAIRAIHVVGGLSLFFSFSEIIGIYLAMRFRNEKNPRANPNLFL